MKSNHVIQDLFISVAQGDMEVISPPKLAERALKPFVAILKQDESLLEQVAYRYLTKDASDWLKNYIYQDGEEVSEPYINGLGLPSEEVKIIKKIKHKRVHVPSRGGLVEVADRNKISTKELLEAAEFLKAHAADCVGRAELIIQLAEMRENGNTR
jgi:reverse gyrase